MKNIDIFLRLIEDVKGPLCIFILFTIIIGAIEFVNATVFFPVVQLLFVNTNIELGYVSSRLLEYLDPLNLVLMIPVLIIIQSVIAILSEHRFVKILAKWRATKSIEYLESIWKTSFANQKALDNGKIEVVIARNLGFSVKLRHLTALMISEFLLSVILIGTSVYINPLTSGMFFILGMIYYLMNRRTIGLRIRNTEDVKKGFNEVANLTSQIFPDFRIFNFYDFRHVKTLFEFPIISACMAQYRTDRINIFMKHLLQPIAIILIFIVGLLISKYQFITIAEFVIVSFLFYRAAPKLVSSVRLYGEISGEIPIDITNELLPIEKYKQLDFNISKSDHTVLEIQNITLKLEDERVLCFPDIGLKKADVLLVKGKSGSGKSTFLDTICGFRPPQSGKVFLNYNNHNHMINRAMLMEIFSIFRQESLIFKGTIAENITFHDNNVEHADVVDICEKFEINKFWDPKQKQDTSIGNFGGNLSAGQRQRVLLARAFIKKPTILILDEPTSNLDVDSEQMVIKLIQEYRKDMIVIIVSHDQSIEGIATHIIDLSRLISDA